MRPQVAFTDVTVCHALGDFKFIWGPVWGVVELKFWEGCSQGCLLIIVKVAILRAVTGGSGKE
jgi:hypothetical protein